MTIKPRREIESSENKCFHAEITIDYKTIPYGFNVLTNEQTQRTNINHTCSNYDSWDENVSVEIQLQNPTEKNSISIAEFLGKYLDLTPIRNVFSNEYGEVDYHYRFPLDAMIKSSMIWRIKSMRSFQKLVNRFEANRQDAQIIGFKNNGNGRCKILVRRTFRHWENIRMDNHTLESAMDRCIIALKNELEKHGEILGKRIGIDSTPLESLFNDDQAGYSGHYEKTGYKIHVAYDLDRNIPLAIIITPMNEGDSPFFKVLLAKLHLLEIKFEKVFADGAYDSYEHFALVHVTYNAKFYTNLGITAINNEKGTEEYINQEYNKFWRWKDFISLDKATMQDKLEYLMKHDKTEIAGAYFRNQLLKERRHRKIQKARENRCSDDLKKRFLIKNYELFF
ncbi:MAG TPA: transposase [Candidatus Thermoplasmatota archaeon]|nr:transposase [Candidatus Thermoplasmatota archaeon]